MKAMVLTSGGLDSATCLGIAVDKIGKENVSAVSIFYGQKQAVELEYARRLAKHYGVAHYELDAAQVMKYSDSSLLQSSEKSVEQSSYSEQMKNNGSNKIDTYVPFRNGLMLSMAASLAYSLYKEDEVEIYIGVHQDDAVINAYPDCSENFIEAMGAALSIGTYGRIKLTAPFVKSTKADVVRTGLKLNVPYELTRSCYESGDKPCGKCATCIDRAKAFRKNGVADPAALN